MKIVVSCLCLLLLLTGCDSEKESVTYQPTQNEQTKLPRVNEMLPYEVLLETKDVTEAQNALKEYAEKGNIEGFTPVIVFDDAHGVMRASIQKIKEDHGDVASYTNTILQLIDVQDVTAFYEQSEQLNKDIFDEDLDDSLGLGEDIMYPGTGYQDEVIYIFKIPTVNSYELPAYLPFLSGEVTVDPAMLCAILKDWYENYGAEMFLLGSTVFQFQYASISEDEAVAFAKKIALLHPAAILRSYGSLENIAYNLMNLKQRYFMIWF